MAKFYFDNISIGDEITYKDRYIEAGFTHWRVSGKLDKSILLIEKNENGVLEKRMIDVSEIETLEIKKAL